LQKHSAIIEKKTYKKYATNASVHFRTNTPVVGTHFYLCRANLITAPD